MGCRRYSKNANYLLEVQLCQEETALDRPGEVGRGPEEVEEVEVGEVAEWVGQDPALVPGEIVFAPVVEQKFLTKLEFPAIT